MNEECGAAEQNSSNIAPEAHDHAQSHTVETQKVSAGTASYSGDDNLMYKIATYVQYYTNAHRYMVL